jgi:hypothetical protein
MVENVQIPDRIEEELRKCNASEFDLKVAKLYFAKRMKGNKVCLVSNDSCFLNTKNLLEKRVFMQSHATNSKEDIYHYQFSVND